MRRNCFPCTATQIFDVCAIFGAAPTILQTAIIVECGRLSHEIASFLYNGAEHGDPQYWPGSLEGAPQEVGRLPNIMTRPNPDCRLEDRTTKQPDFSLFDYTPTLSPALKDFPTVVWEVARTQSSKSLTEDAARWITASLCRTQLVIAIDIVLDQNPRSAPRDGEEDGEGEVESKEGEDQKGWVSTVTLNTIQKKGIKEIWCQFWEPDELVYLDAAPTAQHMNVVIRDDYSAADHRATRYSCIQAIGNRIIKCFASAKKTQQVRCRFFEKARFE